MTLDNARELAIALRNTMPTDPVRKARWIHHMRGLREIIGEEIPLIDRHLWEQLCYSQDD